MSTPPGWYPDPNDERSMRWWDGQAWTNHVQPLPVASEAGAASPEPASPGPATPEPASTGASASGGVPPIEPPPPGVTAAPPQAGAGAATPQGRKASVGPALAVVATVAVLALGLAIAVFASGVGSSDTAGGETADQVDEGADLPAPPEPDGGVVEDDESPPGQDEGPGEAPPPAAGTADAELAAVEGQPVIDGTPLPRVGDGTDDPAVGNPVPVVDGAGPTGAPVSFGSSGEPQLVLMVASWCPACHQQIPEFVTWRDEGGDDDVEVVVVVTLLEPDRPGWPADEWAIEEGLPADLVMDDRYNSVADAYGLNAVPYWVVIDADGNLVQRQAGVIPPEQISELARLARNGAD